MSKPALQRFSFGGAVWWVVSARYASAARAKRAWERIEKRTPRGQLGIYRHGPPDAVGCFVSIVSLAQREVEAAVALLSDGQAAPLDLDLARMLIVRRARVVVDADRQGANAGRLKWRRAETRGAKLGPDGTMHEPKGNG